MTYRGHTITRDTGAPLARYCWHVDGPLLHGTTFNGVANAKRWVDDCYVQDACPHTERETNADRAIHCVACHKFFGRAPRS
jgi:hypothetical protein